AVRSAKPREASPHTRTLSWPCREVEPQGHQVGRNIEAIVIAVASAPEGFWGAVSEFGRLRHRDGTHGRGDRAAGGHDPERIPVPFPDSHSIPTLISSEFPRIDVCGRALRKDEKAPAIQDDVYLEGGRVDVGGCGGRI